MNPALSSRPSRPTLLLLLALAGLALPACEKPAPSVPAASAAAGQGDAAASAKRSRGWVCDMACEGCKTFDAKGTCPVCKMDLRPYEEVPFAGQLKLSVAPQVGQPLDLRLTLADPAGCTVDPATFDPRAGRTVHAAILSLSPDYLGKPGVILEPRGVVRLTGATPTKPGKHLLVCAFDPPNLPPQVVTAEFEVPGDAAPKPTPAPPFALPTRTKAKLRAGELELENNPPQFFRHSENVVRVRPSILPKPGTPVRLNVAGSQAAVVRADLNYAAPGLPLGDRTDELAVFRVEINEPGAYRTLVWLNTDQGAELAEFWLSAPEPPARPQPGTRSPGQPAPPGPAGSPPAPSSPSIPPAPGTKP